MMRATRQEFFTRQSSNSITPLNSRLLSEADTMHRLVRLNAPGADFHRQSMELDYGRQVGPFNMHGKAWLISTIQ